MPRLEFRYPEVRERSGINPFSKEPLVIPGRPERIRFFEAEQRERTVFYASGESGGVTRLRQTEHPSEDEAYGAMAQALASKRRAGYAPVGPAREIAGSELVRKGSALLIDLYFEVADERFLDEVLAFDGPKKLAALAKPWFDDTRPFARRALLAYIDDGCARLEHKALVKRLFKLAEVARDGELMAHFMVAFDRLTRRPLRAVNFRFDAATRRSVPVLGLTVDPTVRERLEKDESAPEFTRVTRRYLARRAFRYFRRIGYGDLLAYRRAVVPALELYRDEHLSSVGRLLAAWGLLHILYGRSSVLNRNPKGILLASGRTLAELMPEPIFSAAWDQAFDELFGLLRRAHSRPVRFWALGLLRARYAADLASLGLAQVKSLVLSASEEAQVLGVELFTRLPGLEQASLADWLELLGAENLEVLSAVCERATSIVSGARLSLEQCVELSLSPAAPIAALGLLWLKEKRIGSEPELVQCLRLSRAKVATVRADAAAHNAQLLRTLPFVRPEHVRDLCDAQHVEVRGHGLGVVSERFPGELSLWSALCESPYPDVRSFVLSHAERFRLQSPTTLSHLLGTVLFALSGAAADKRRAAREIAARIAAKPAEAETLLPLLRATLKSVHPAERTLTLSALVKIAHQRDSLRELLRSGFPELSIAAQVSE